MTQAEMDRIWQIVEAVNADLAGGITPVTWGQVACRARSRVPLPEPA